MIRSASLSSIELQQFYQSKREKVDRLAEKVIAHMVDFHDILTPEQREKLAANLEQHREKGRCRFFGH